MSVSDPLLKDLKICIINLINVNNGKPINDDDNHSELETLCASLEAILRKGLVCAHLSPFGITKKDYWSWIHQTIPLLMYDAAFKISLNHHLDTPKVTTPQGRGKLFIRHSLNNGCLHVPVEYLVRKKYFDKLYTVESIVGDEILGEIFLSLLYQLSQLKFELKIENSSFLDETWKLPEYKEYVFRPCFDLGIYLGHVKGWAVVLNVDEGSIAADDNKIEKGDVIDEIFGVCIKGWRKNRISTLFRQNKGLPIPLKVIKGHNKDGSIFKGLVPILERLQLDIDCIQDPISSEKSVSESEEMDNSFCPLNGHLIDYLGSVEVGSCGDVTHIENSVISVLSLDQSPISVMMVTGEIGVRTICRTSQKILLNHSFTEISSCGRRNDNPYVFGYISGDTSCSISSHFTCHVFRTSSDEVARDILLTLADGFHRTHWAV